MADPVTVGVLVAEALRLGAEEVVKGTVGELVKDAYQKLKAKLSSWFAHDVEALEKQPSSKARQAVVAESVDGLPPADCELLRTLAQALTEALEARAPEIVGIDIGRLKALHAELGNITVTAGTGARIKDADVGTFKTGDLSVGPPGKSMQ
jgi:hypothetical protein